MSRAWIMKYALAIRQYVFQLAMLQQIYLRLFWLHKLTHYIYFALLLISTFFIPVVWRILDNNKKLNIFPLQEQEDEGGFQLLRNATMNIVGKISETDLKRLQISANKLKVNLKRLSKVSEYDEYEYTIIVYNVDMARNILDYRLRQEKIDYSLWYSGNPFGDVITLEHLIRHHYYGKFMKLWYRTSRSNQQYTFDVIFLDAIGICNITTMLKSRIYYSSLKVYFFPDTANTIYSFLYILLDLLILVPMFVLLKDFSGSRNANPLLRSLGVSSFQIALNKVFYGMWLIAPICLLGLLSLQYREYTWDMQTRTYMFAYVLLYALCKSAFFVLMDELFGGIIYVLFIATLVVHFTLFALAVFCLPASTDFWATAFASLNPAAGLAMSFHTQFILNRREDSPYISPFPTTLSRECYVAALLLSFLLHMCFIMMIPFFRENRFKCFEAQSKSRLKACKINEALSDENVVITNLRKAWHGTEMVLKGVNLKTKNNTITTLLGENGCGKSTLFSCLDGKIEPTDGHIFICGKELSANKAMCQRMIGLCPQDNPVIQNLTVYEHLVLFFRLRTLRLETQHEIKELVHMVNNCRMIKKLNEDASTLSGGQLRKLFVMTAFVGYPKVVLLDEPMAGVDHISRRDFRNFIVNMKTDKSIIITTHYLAEVELFTDSVAFLSRGEIICHDTIEELTRIYLRGVRISIAFERVASLSASNEFARLCTKLLEFIKTQTDGAAYLCDQDYDCGSENELKIIVPFAAKKMLPALFIELEARRREFLIEAFTTQSSLEEIFIRATSNATDENSFTHMPKYECVKNPILLRMNQFLGLIRKAALSFIRKWRLFITPFIILLLVSIPYALLHYRMVGWKLYTVRERPIYIGNLPSVTILLISDKLKNRNIKFFNGWYTYLPPNPKRILYKSADEVDKFLEKFYKFFRTKNFSNVKLLGYGEQSSDSKERMFSITHPPRAFGFMGVNWEVGTSLAHNVYPYKIQFNGWLCYGEMYGINFFTNFLLAVNGKNGSVVSGLEVRPTQKQLAMKSNKLAKILESVAARTINALLYVIFFGIYIYNEVEERNCMFQHQIYLAKTPKALRIFTEAFFLFFYFIVYSCLIFTMAYFYQNLSINVIYRVIGAMLLYYCYNIFDVFMISVWFKSPSKAYIFYTIMCGVFGIMMYWYVVKVTIYAIYFMGTDPYALALHENYIDTFFYTLFPALSIDFVILRLALTDGSSILDFYRILNTLFVNSLIRLTLLYLVETKLIRLVLMFWRKQKLTQLMYVRQPRMLSLETSPLLSASNGCVKKNSAQTYNRTSCLLKGIYKFYKGRTCAIHDLNLEVQRGESFALLGTNGAGKTTAFNILSSVIIPSTGLALIEREKVELGDASIAYCPQNYALTDYMTPWEMLQIVAKLYGVRNSQKQVRETLYALRLNTKADKLVRTLSGGQKRRLSLGVALMNGGKALTILDEPTAGIDVRSRWHIWRILKDLTLTKSTTILLITHDMEECELLCGRVGFMNRGCLLALGTCQQLKLHLLHTVTLKIFIRNLAFNTAMSVCRIQNLHEQILQTFDVLNSVPSDADALNENCLPIALTYELALNGQTWSRIYANVAAFIDNVQAQPPTYQAIFANNEQKCPPAYQTLANKQIDAATLNDSKLLETDSQQFVGSFPEIIDFSLAHGSMEQVFEMLAQKNLNEAKWYCRRCHKECK